MTESSRAVFLSYASQDAEEAGRICMDLRAAGIEVWFDQSELRGGDAWDQLIRRQIRDCALFVPIISAHTQIRTEGYFRLEWHLADQRKLLMTKNRPFLVPVCIDATAEADAEVPDSFSAVQWTRLPEGQTTTAFVNRILSLLSRKPLPALTANRSSSAVGAPVTPHVIQAPAGRRADVNAVAFVPMRTAVPEKSVAVLPFADMSEKKDQEYFSDGLSEELIEMLSRVQELRVPARTSSFYFKGKNEPVAGIAEKLRVANVLEGSVRKAGNKLRITVQLIRADNGYHLWSETYDRDAKDIFKVQDEITSAVVSALRLKLLLTNQEADVNRSSNADAYDQYLRGMHYEHLGDLESERLALQAYNAAIALDPRYASANAGLSFTESEIADFTVDEAGYARAQAAAERALALSPHLTQGYRARPERMWKWRLRFPPATARFRTTTEMYWRLSDDCQKPRRR
jgi:TolB-like protein